jgi:hypothetical protein
LLKVFYLMAVHMFCFGGDGTVWHSLLLILSVCLGVHYNMKTFEGKIEKKGAGGIVWRHCLCMVCILSIACSLQPTNLLSVCNVNVNIRSIGRRRTTATVRAAQRCARARRCGENENVAPPRAASRSGGMMVRRWRGNENVCLVIVLLVVGLLVVAG